jgi:CMP-N,N'-diacetyllegionaminic acid synthase
VGRAVCSAVGASRVDACFVSSDSEEILEEGRRWGAECHLRDVWASSDHAQATDVVSAFLPTLIDKFPGTDPFLVYLQPTSPLRVAQHVDDCLLMLAEAEDSIAASISTRPIHLDKLVSIDETDRIAHMARGAAATGNRQDSPTSWAPNGAIYVFHVSVFRERGSFPIAGARAFWMDPLSSTDVDSEQDLALADAIVRSRHAGTLDR